MWFKITTALLAFIAAGVLFIVTYLILLSGKKSTIPTPSQITTISGKFSINGVIPDGATLNLTEKELHSSQQANTIITNLPAVDESPWSFNNAVSGKSYEIQAQVIVNGKVISSSSPLAVSAPAQEELIKIDIQGEDVVGTAVISGMIDVNGYIPNGSTITIQGRELGKQTFTTVAADLQGQSRQFLSYPTAKAGTTYEVLGVLKTSSGAIIGTSSLLTVTAPALNEVLIINSTATPPITPSPIPLPTTFQPQSTPTPQNTPVPQQPVSISGNINFNGVTPPNSRIVIFQKPTNSSNYQVAVDNISPTNGVTWQWNNPQLGTWYNLIAILKQKNSNGTDTDISTSAPVTVAAPAASVSFTINSGFSLSAPTGGISVTCQTYNSGPNQNTWNVVVNFQSVSGAQSYWYQIGSTNGGNDVLSTANQTNNQSQQTVNTVFKNNTTYYARYAYATVPVASLTSGQYSGFSSTTALQCSH